MQLPMKIAERCLQGHHANERWLKTLKAIWPALVELAAGDKALLGDLKSQSLHLWSSAEASGRLPPEAGLQPEPEGRPSDTATAANIKHAKLPGS